MICGESWQAGLQSADDAGHVAENPVWKFLLPYFIP